MPTPESTSLTPAQQQRAEALAFIRQHFGLPGGFTGLGRERLPMEAASPVIALAEWILEERPQPASAGPVVVGEPAVPGSRERPLAMTDEVWTTDTALAERGTDAALRQWWVAADGTFVEQAPHDDVEDLDEQPDDDGPTPAQEEAWDAREEAQREPALVGEQYAPDAQTRPNAGPCPLCDEIVAQPLLAGHLKMHDAEILHDEQRDEEVDRG